MFKTLDEIKEQLEAGEDSFAEFKELRFGQRGIISPNTEDIAGEMVAFANTEGGALFLGVDDSGIVRGIPNDRINQVEQWIINVAANNCNPPIRPIIRKVILPDLTGADVKVMIVSIPKSLYVHRTSGGRWYIKVGSTKRDATPQELARLFQQRGRLFVFDEMAVPTASETDLNGETIRGFFGSEITIPINDLMVNTRIVTKDEEGMLRPTVAGILAFGIDPQEHLPSTYIEAAVYRGTAPDSNKLVHSDSIKGTVSTQIDSTVAFVKRFMLKPATKNEGRIDFPQYAISAVHEAIVNAVAHRDYSISGSKIRLFMYDDRLELMSPGGLPNTITLETLPYRQFTRNQLLVSFLSKMKSKTTGTAYIEARGEGVRKIISESTAHSGRKPEYRLAGEELILTIWAKPSPHDV